ncbi:Serine protease inhibitor- potato inhibitor I-type family protein [Striga hermonthica]|uniref:Serine protease inhibitor- potato inhibitor I-type family protein n=1 Tax=Striga hermonthica TaxID=68872 RepID=A0A9N7N7D2_STRHE|nr:Serine protease inhibitor- potato inhibitor I-type family protein [Striga hermonthica]
MICEGKQSWPELVGVSAEIAVQTIQSENSFVTAIVYSMDDPAIIIDFSCNRVFVFVDDQGIVGRVPYVG